MFNCFCLWVGIFPITSAKTPLKKVFVPPQNSMQQNKLKYVN